MVSLLKFPFPCTPKCCLLITCTLYVSSFSDIQICQWLRNEEGALKLGDFNRAEIPLFDPVKEEYCAYNNGYAYGNYRSPEEFSAQDLDEKIDVFSFGNNIYGLVSEYSALFCSYRYRCFSDLVVYM